MKLRNKKTGEVYNVINESIKLSVGDRSAQHSGHYTSLAELNEEWEDYEEPNEYYCIDWTERRGIYKTRFGDARDAFNQVIGNCFRTEEEAEKAVEKLKAWKRLKDKGFINEQVFSMNLNWCNPDDDDWKAFHLLFGGEE